MERRGRREKRRRRNNAGIIVCVIVMAGHIMTTDNGWGVPARGRRRRRSRGLGRDPHYESEGESAQKT